jgi:hypothetical protein
MSIQGHLANCFLNPKFLNHATQIENASIKPPICCLIVFMLNLDNVWVWSENRHPTIQLMERFGKPYIMLSDFEALSLQLTNKRTLLTVYCLVLVWTTDNMRLLQSSRYWRWGWPIIKPRR